MTEIAVVNWSGGTISNADLAFACAAVDDQLAECAKAWGLDPWPVTFVADASVVTDPAIHVMAICDELGNADLPPGADGYHTQVNGVVFGKVLASATSVSKVLSHECLEMLVDPSSQATRAGVPLEICDPVEDQTYWAPTTLLGETRQVELANYVYPNWFEAGSQGPWDKMGKLSGPLTMSQGGYEE